MLAISRLVLAVILDLLSAEIRMAEVATDSSLLLLFLTLFLYGYKKTTIRTIHPIFGFLFTVLLGINFVQFDGVFGMPRFNYYCGIFVIGLLYNGRWLFANMLFQCLMVGILSFATAFKLDWISPFSLGQSADLTDFIFAVCALSILAFYLKKITLAEIEKYDQLNEQLSKNVRQAKQTNQLLIKKSNELRQAQIQLNQEVKRRTLTLKDQQEAIESYIHLNTTVLLNPVQQLNVELDQLPNNTLLSTMLMASRDELNEVLRSIKNTLESQEKLDRKKIK